MADVVYEVTVGRRVVRITLRRTAEHYVVRVDDGEERPAHLETVHGTLRSLALGEQKFELLAQREASEVHVAIAGLEYRAEVLDEAHARLASLAGSRATSHIRRELKAPMPGLVVKVLCEPGDDVGDGQPLAILRAMKMENELALPRGGRVTAVHARPGQTVEQGQVLVVVE